MEPTSPSQGKALSEREEAVLQALEVLTRHQVARLVGQAVDKMGEAL